MCILLMCVCYNQVLALKILMKIKSRYLYIHIYIVFVYVHMCVFFNIHLIGSSVLPWQQLGS